MKPAYVLAALLLCVVTQANSADMARVQNQAGHYVVVTDNKDGCPTKTYPRRAYSKDRNGTLYYGCWRYDSKNIYIQWDKVPGGEVVYPMYLFENLMGRDT